MDTRPWRRGNAFTLRIVGDGSLPQLFTRGGVVREHAAVLYAAEQPSIQKRDAAIVSQLGRLDRFVHPPFLRAGIGIDGEGVHFARPIQRAPDDDGPGLEAGLDA